MFANPPPCLKSSYYPVLPSHKYGTFYDGESDTVGGCHGEKGITFYNVFRLVSRSKIFPVFEAAPRNGEVTSVRLTDSPEKPWSLCLLLVNSALLGSLNLFMKEFSFACLQGRDLQAANTSNHSRKRVVRSPDAFNVFISPGSTYDDSSFALNYEMTYRLSCFLF